MVLDGGSPATLKWLRYIREAKPAKAILQKPWIEAIQEGRK